MKKLIKKRISGTNRYRIMDGDRILSERVTKKEYIAATADGSIYFGREDLIGKGKHGAAVKRAEAYANYSEEDFNRDKDFAYENMRRFCELERRTVNVPDLDEYMAECERDYKERIQRLYPNDEKGKWEEITLRNRWGRKRLQELQILYVL